MNDKKPKYNDYPIEQCAEKAEQYIRNGARIYQKFTCEKCGQRLTMDEPNVFYETGDCDQCGHVTDIRKNGCNYMMVQ
jgi:hypothetical protein